MINPRVDDLVPDDAVPRVARVRNDRPCDGVVRQDGDIVTVGIPTPVPVQNILSRGGIDLETCDIALLIPVVAYHDVCVQGWGEKNRRN